MNEQSQAVVDTIIAEIERQEAAIRAVWEEEIEWKAGDWLRPGWAYGIFFTWDCHRHPKQNEISCFFEWQGVSIYHSEGRERKAKASLSFLTTAILEEEIIPALKEYLQKKVDEEPWGGVYGARLALSLTFNASRDPLPIDPPHMQGRIWEQPMIRVQSPDRMAKELQLFRDFITERRYETEDLQEISTSLDIMSSRVARDLYGELGAEALTAFYETVLARTLERDPDDFGDIASGFAGAANALIKPERSLAPAEEYAEEAEENPESADGEQPDEAMLHLACQLCMWLLMHGTDKYEKEYGTRALKLAEQQGSTEAKNILKFGTGQIAPEVMLYKDKLVSCAANDINKVIDLKLKEESKEAYLAMVQYIIRLIQAGFPAEYVIKFNSKEKNYIKGLPKTKNQLFWNNAARYPALWPLMKEYVRLILSPYDYYDDADCEEAVPVGGWAVFALGLASAENDDIVREFMDENDSEHSITPSYFVGEWLSKYGLTTKNAETVTACILGANERYAVQKITGLEDAEALQALVAALHACEATDYEVSMVIDALWCGEDRLKKAAAKAPATAKTWLELLLSMTEEDDDDDDERP